MKNYIELEVFTLKNKTVKLCRHKETKQYFILKNREPFSCFSIEQASDQYNECIERMKQELGITEKN